MESAVRLAVETARRPRARACTPPSTKGPKRIPMDQKTAPTMLRASWRREEVGGRLLGVPGTPTAGVGPARPHSAPSPAAAGGLASSRVAVPRKSPAKYPMTPSTVRTIAKMAWK